MWEFGKMTIMSHSDRINQYWRAVGKYRLSGYDCKEPWSAAFISWIMRAAGVPKDLFPPSSAHRFYLNRFLANAHDPFAALIPHTIQQYKPTTRGFDLRHPEQSRASRSDRETPGLSQLKAALRYRRGNRRPNLASHRRQCPQFRFQNHFDLIPGWLLAICEPKAMVFDYRKSLGLIACSSGQFLLFFSITQSRSRPTWLGDSEAATAATGRLPPDAILHPLAAFRSVAVGPPRKLTSPAE
jgi:hypothetical protein